MLNLKELWIGDRIKLIASGRVGKFEGIHTSGRARININGKIHLSSSSNLMLYEEEEAEPLLHFEEDVIVNKPVDDIIDLHIDILKPDLANNMPARIFDYQMQALKEYIKNAKSSYKNEFTIIHGKGTGVLRQSVMDYVKSEKAIKFYEVINDGGAVKIHL